MMWITSGDVDAGAELDGRSSLISMGMCAGPPVVWIGAGEVDAGAELDGRSSRVSMWMCTGSSGMRIIVNVLDVVRELDGRLSWSSTRIASERATCGAVLPEGEGDAVPDVVE
jgi:hypothetical protein